MKIFATVVLISFASVFSVQASAAPAYIVKDTLCNGFIPNPNTESGLPGVAPLQSTRIVGIGAVEDKVGKVTCHFDHEFPLDTAVEARGWICVVLDRNGDPIATDNTLMLATPGGKALLRCKFGPIPKER